MAKIKYVFCFQAYNDIDHITPVIDRLCREHPEVKVAGVVFAPQNRFDNDFRIRHLESIGVSVSHVIDHIAGKSRPSWLTLYFRLHAIASNDKTPRIIRIALRLLYFPLKKKYAFLMATFNPKNFLNSVAGEDRVVALCYDHTSSHPAYNALSKLGKKIGFFTAALPHAVDNWDNELLKITDTNPFPNKSQNAYQCDAVLLPDQRNLDQMQARNQIIEGQGVKLGSPRFCDEWVKKIRAIAPPYPMPDVPTGSFKIVFMLCRPHLNIFEDEVMRLIVFVSRIPGVEVMVKLHTRNHMLGKTLPSNIHFADNDVPSHNLIDWADLTLFSATSVILDNLKLDKPVLFLRRTVANKLIFERYINNWNIDCRDDLRDIIVGLRDGTIQRTYTIEERDALLSALVEPVGKDVLGLYVDYIASGADKVRTDISVSSWN